LLKDHTLTTTNNLFEALIVKDISFHHVSLSGWFQWLLLNDLLLTRVGSFRDSLVDVDLGPSAGIMSLVNASFVFQESRINSKRIHYTH
jgi:hypothetical protein